MQAERALGPETTLDMLSHRPDGEAVFVVVPRGVSVAHRSGWRRRPGSILGCGVCEDDGEAGDLLPGGVDHGARSNDEAGDDGGCCGAAEQRHAHDHDEEQGEGVRDLEFDAPRQIAPQPEPKGLRMAVDIPHNVGQCAGGGDHQDLEQCGHPRGCVEIVPFGGDRGPARIVKSETAHAMEFDERGAGDNAMSHHLAGSSCHSNGAFCGLANRSPRRTREPCRLFI